MELVLAWNASVNIYAFSSGTNFGLWNGAVEDTTGNDDIPTALIGDVGQW